MIYRREVKSCNHLRAGNEVDTSTTNISCSVWCCS